MKTVPVASPNAVRAMIAGLLQDGDPSLRATAKRLGISPRSLQRQLATIGTSYSDLVAEVRLATACHLLTESELSIASIADRLGYSGPSSFSRIFMRLMNIQPAVYRRQRMAGLHARRGGGGSRRPTGPAATE
ncbi:helix-turn-helix transcriptional regulator [Bosea sp. BK604]|uniref:helix-turn-helix domain-containing protein n=1 Tax=Bosea sp. BK604 TaxID=2512180 RepID=UPI0010DA5BE5|nr:helix-turn-helix transcriptional regulator [Bosea sp. BK604]TCR67172.1 helix-turn-helix protein [Bosea sp. BK604]